MRKITVLSAVAIATLFSTGLLSCGTSSGGETSAKTPNADSSKQTGAPTALRPDSALAKTDTTQAVQQPDITGIDTTYEVTPAVFGLSDMVTDHPITSNDSTKKDTRLTEIHYVIHIKLEANSPEKKMEISDQDNIVPKADSADVDSIAHFDQVKFKNLYSLLDAAKIDTLLVTVNETGEPGHTTKEIIKLKIKGRKEQWKGKKVIEAIDPLVVWTKDESENE